MATFILWLGVGLTLILPSLFHFQSMEQVGAILFLIGLVFVLVGR